MAQHGLGGQKLPRIVEKRVWRHRLIGTALTETSHPKEHKESGQDGQDWDRLYH